MDIDCPGYCLTKAGYTLNRSLARHEAAGAEMITPARLASYPVDSVASAATQGPVFRPGQQTPYAVPLGVGWSQRGGRTLQLHGPMFFLFPLRQS